MMANSGENFSGPYLAAAGISLSDLASGVFNTIDSSRITNGLILELKQYSLGQSQHSFFHYLHEIFPVTISGSRDSHSRMQVKLHRLQKIRNNLGKKRQGIKEFLDDAFKLPPACTKSENAPDVELPDGDAPDVELPDGDFDDISVPQSVPSYQYTTANSLSSSDNVQQPPLSSVITLSLSQNEPEVVSGQQQVPPVDEQGPAPLSQGRTTMNSMSSDSSDIKVVNHLNHEIQAKRATLSGINAKITEKKDELLEVMKQLSQIKGHFSKRNVEKRDQGHQQRMLELQTTLKEMKDKIKSLELEINIKDTQKDNDIKKLLDTFAKEKDEYQRKIDELNAKLDKEKLKKGREQKLKNYYKGKKVIKATDDTSKHQIISSLENELEETKERLVSMRTVQKETKVGGRFTDDLRLTIMELISLEVAAEKATPVIQAVSKQLFKVDIPKRDLPNLQSVINIADEGHYLMKWHIASELVAGGSWGLNKDGTTRKCEHLMDTAVTDSSGKVHSLGFRKVSHEDSDTVKNVCSDTIDELGEIAAHGAHSELTKEEFRTELLRKWSFIMNDRAATEKATNRKLIEWRDHMLSAVDIDDKDIVHTFYCSAHVLLGFHRNCIKNLDVQQATFRQEGRKLGRDALPRFWTWSRTSAAERAVRMTSEVFGPVGDYIGLKHRWDAACKTIGMKSIIKSYKDNRFNGIFEVAAQVIYHRDDFLSLMSEVEAMLKAKKQKLNQKLVSVQADLKCPYLMTIVQALGLMFIFITGPFWDLVNSPEIPYLHLYRYFQPLYANLKSLVDDPLHLLDADAEHPIIPDFPPKLNDMAERVCTPMFTDRDLLCKTLKLLTEGFIKTMEDQLGDFLAGGQYSSAPDEKELLRTRFSHLTNISCEHHFGSLDSSQRRRPNASFHHHSTVELLKKNFPSFLTSFGGKNDVQKSELLQQARKHGRELRLKHQLQEKEVNREIQDDLKIKEQIKKKATKLVNKAKTRSRKRPAGVQSAEPKKKKQKVKHSKPLEPLKPVDLTEEMSGKYVAVIYTSPQLSWYPGVVCKVISQSECLVKFMENSKPNTNSFKWPTSDNKEQDSLEKVDSAHIFYSDFSISPIDQMGRRWSVSCFQEIVKNFKKHAKYYNY